jgi:hypothetical protein
MTKRKTTVGKAGAKKLKLRKETLKDLQPRGKGVKGGGLVAATLRGCAGISGNACGGAGTGTQTIGCQAQTLGLGCGVIPGH